MAILLNMLLWLHLVGLAMGIGGGLALSQIGPRLTGAPADQRDQWWPLKTFFSRLAMIGLAILLVSGPLMLWLKFGGPGGMTPWFWAKMALVLVGAIGIGVSEIASRRFAQGDNRAIPLMAVSGQATGISMLLVVLCAVFAFN